jgi:hypothetical protein
VKGSQPVYWCSLNNLARMGLLTPIALKSRFICVEGVKGINAPFLDSDGRELFPFFFGLTNPFGGIRLARVY